MTDAEPRRILVVDDDAAARRMLRRLLERRGYAVVEGDSGEAAVELTRSGRPDCLLLDLRMPGRLSGAGAIGEIRADASCSRTPIVLVSASVHSIGDGTSIGADAFVAKPVDFDELLSVLERLLSRQS